MTNPGGPDQARLLFLSSDRRRRYKEDVLTALSLPPDSPIQFRYGSDYVSAALQRLVANGAAIGAEAILAFVSGVDADQPFFLPVRYAVVLEAACIADIFVFKLVVKSQVNMENYPTAFDEIVAQSRPWLLQLAANNGNHYQPAVSSFPELRISSSRNPADGWLGVARRLSTHPTFASSYFVRIDSPKSQKGNELAFDSAGRLQLADQRSAVISVSFYSEQYDPLPGVSLSCTTDGTFLKVSSDTVYDVALRYDSVEYWLQPATANYDCLTRVTLELKASAEHPAALVPARATIPVVVRRSRSRLATRVLTSTVGAFLVALPAILGPSSPVELRVIFAIVGAFLLAGAAVILSSPKA